MSDLTDRRARKKAQTRALIRRTAQELFAARGFESVTIADIAGAADVAVQTVFNHFSTKEDLFFDGRTPWVEGAAEAVRSRPRSVPPLAALREYLVGVLGGLAGQHECGERRRYIATIEASPALRLRELELVHEAERRTAQALVEAWADGDTSGARVPEDPATAAALTAATWVAVSRVLLVGQRPVLGDRADAARSAATIVSLAEQVLGDLELGFGALPTAPPAHSVTGWPEQARQAG
ncbi:TetR/AcrR family transcriptional regulator [Geodermatophilus sp. CPCC 205506]|uniref:TetR/AcrR family transcriptional regulator n=1 Tax=Geodermatophilus sp. CPCC 205506 TaxID=2936596 RepID=UPI003EED1D4D